MRKSRPLVVAGHRFARPARGAGAPRPSWASPRPTARMRRMLADPGIEAVYNPLPNHLHVPLTLAAAQGRQARAVREADGAARRRSRGAAAVRVARSTSAKPSWCASTRSGSRRASSCGVATIGELRYHPGRVQLLQRRPGEHPQPGRHRRRRAVRHRLLCDRRRALVLRGRARARRSPPMDRDPALRDRPQHQRCCSTSAAGASSRSRCRTQAARYQRVELVGTRGRIEIEIPFNAPQDAAAALPDRRRQRARRQRQRDVTLCRWPTSTSCRPKRSRTRCARSSPTPAALDDAMWQHARHRRAVRVGEERPVREALSGRARAYRLSTARRASASNRFASVVGQLDLHAQQLRGDGLAQVVAAQAVRRAAGECAVEHELQRQDVGQRVALDARGSSLAEQVREVLGDALAA